MSEPLEQPLIEPPVTALRRDFDRARALPPGQQIEECADQVQHPGLLSAEVLSAYRTMEDWFSTDSLERSGLDNPDEGGPVLRSTTLAEEYIWPHRELVVLGDKCSFTCLDTNVHPLRTDDLAFGNPLSAGFDYVGVTCDESAQLVLGAVQAPGDAAAYPLLLRILACLTEIAPKSQIERLDRECFKGLAGEDPIFDLNLVLWDCPDVAPEIEAISQLTRDLAERVKTEINTGADFPTRLRDIVCLRMNPDRFDGRMRFAWRV